MRSSTSSSEARFLAALLLTFGALFGAWETLLRHRASAATSFSIDKPKLAGGAEAGHEWLVFGNCLMMTGISPRKLASYMGEDAPKTIINIAMHEQSPIAFFEYLRSANHYPDVVFANVSSWLNGTSYEQEGEIVTHLDPLGIKPVDGSLSNARGSAEHDSADGAYRQSGELGQGAFQQRSERELTEWIGANSSALGHRYHLFDYSMFLWTLTTSWSLDGALYQLNMQSWFRVAETETDGLGYLGLRVRYSDDWSNGLDRMAERSAQRLRLSNLLTKTYWDLLEAQIRHFQAHGTKVVLVRMPEHPKIFALNEERYEISQRMHAIEGRTGAPIVDLAKLGPGDGVKLFDAVHPDASAADVITRAVGAWIRGRGDVGKLKPLVRAGGG